MREIFRRRAVVIGVERFMRIYPFPPGMETVGLMFKLDTDIERGDVIRWVKQCEMPPEVSVSEAKN